MTTSVVRCYWCGHRKDKWNQLCESCLRYPPKDPERENGAKESSLSQRI